MPTKQPLSACPPLHLCLLLLIIPVTIALLSVSIIRLKTSFIFLNCPKRFHFSRTSFWKTRFAGAFRRSFRQYSAVSFAHKKKIISLRLLAAWVVLKHKQSTLKLSENSIRIFLPSCTAVFFLSSSRRRQHSFLAVKKKQTEWCIYVIL